MKKILILLSFILASVASFGQFVNTQTVASASTDYKSRGGITADSLVHLAPVIFADTTAANWSVVSKYSGALIQVSPGQIWWRSLNPNQWHLFSSSTGGGFLPISDTTAMLLPYLRKSDTSNLVSPYLRKSDTAFMLASYVRFSDTANLVAPYLRISDTASMLSNYYNKTAADGRFVPLTRTVSTNAPLGGGGALSGNLTLTADTGRANAQIVSGGSLNQVKDSLVALIASSGGGTVLSVSTTDEFGIISSVANPTSTPNISLRADTISLATRYTADSIAILKVNISDTSSMLSNYLRKTDTLTMLSTYLRKSDTTTMLLPYLRKTDTSNMLLPYLRKTDTLTMLLPYLRKTDTATMLTGYTRVQRFLDTTTTLRTLINTKSDGTVKSVGLSLPSIFSVSGSPVTTSGTLTATLANQSANLVWASPISGSAAQPTFRALVAADLPDTYLPISDTASMLSPYQKKFIVYIENYRGNLSTDDSVINAAITASPDGASYYFQSGRTYTLTNQIDVNKNGSFYGNGSVIKRADNTESTLSVSASYADTQITLTSIPSNWKIGDNIQVYHDSSYLNSTTKKTITNIVGNTVYLDGSLASQGGGITTWTTSDHARKVFDLFIAPESSTWEINFYNMVFDGNWANNNQNYYWNANGNIRMYGNNNAHVQGCRFYNIPNENILGQGLIVTGNFGNRMYGSFFHSSANQLVSKDLKSTISFNTVDTSNVATSLSGHSEGTITLSFSSGNLNIIGNHFFNGSGSLIGPFQTSTDPADGIRGNIVITSNFCKNFHEIMGTITNNPPYTPTKNIFFTANTFDSCGTTDLTSDYSTNTGLKFSNDNVLVNGTVVLQSTALYDSSKNAVLSINGVQPDSTGNVSLSVPSGTVTSVSVVTANGVSGSVATSTTTPAITLTLGAITPSSVVSSGEITTTGINAVVPDGITGPKVARFGMPNYGHLDFYQLIGSGYVQPNGLLMKYTNQDAVSFNSLFFKNDGSIVLDSSITASSFIKSGGTSSQALIADGSVLTLNDTTYTPTLSNITGTSGLSANTSHAIRVGNTVSVDFYVTGTASNGTNQFYLSIPFGANFTGLQQSNGSGGVSITGVSGISSAQVYAQSGQTDVIVTIINSGSSNTFSVRGTFQYEVQ